MTDKQDLIAELRDQLITEQQHKEDHDRIIDKLDELVSALTKQTTVLESNAVRNDEDHTLIKEVLAYIKQLVDTLMEFLTSWRGFSTIISYGFRAVFFIGIGWAIFGDKLTSVIN